MSSDDELYKTESYQNVCSREDFATIDEIFQIKDENPYEEDEEYESSSSYEEDENHYEEDENHYEEDEDLNIKDIFNNMTFLRHKKIKFIISKVHELQQEEQVLLFEQTLKYYTNNYFFKEELNTVIIELMEYIPCYIIFNNSSFFFNYILLESMNEEYMMILFLTKIDITDIPDSYIELMINTPIISIYSAFIHIFLIEKNISEELFIRLYPTDTFIDALMQNDMVMMEIYFEMMLTYRTYGDLILMNNDELSSILKCFRQINYDLLEEYVFNILYIFKNNYLANEITIDNVPTNLLNIIYIGYAVLNINYDFIIDIFNQCFTRNNMVDITDIENYTQTNTIFYLNKNVHLRITNQYDQINQIEDDDNFDMDILPFSI